MQSKIIDARIAAGEKGLLRNDQYTGREQDDGAQFGDAVDGQPTQEVDGEIAIVVQGDESAERETLVGRQHDGRNADSQAEAERHDSDCGVVAEQDVGEYAEGI